MSSLIARHSTIRFYNFIFQLFLIPIGDREYFSSHTALFSAVVLEHFLKTAAGEEDAAFYSSERKIHFFGNLIIFISCHMHGEGYAIIIAE